MRRRAESTWAVVDSVDSGFVYFRQVSARDAARRGATAFAVHLMTDTGDPGTGRGPHRCEATARSAIVRVRQPSCPTKERVR